MLKGSEKELAQKIVSALGVNEKELASNWEKIAGAILSHLMEKSTIIGVAPPNGGPIQEGKLA